MDDFYQMKIFHLLFSWSIPLLLFTTSTFAQGDPVILGSGNTEGMNITTSHDQGGTTGEQTMDGLGLLPNLNATSRFLAQAAFGADMETIEAVSEIGYSDWIDAQLDTARGFSIEQFTKNLAIMAIDSTLSMGGDPNSVKARMYYWHSAWWQYTMTSPDVLRNRVALALSEIFVISELPQLEDFPLGLANYYDMLLDNAFGNYRDLLEDVTFHPTMGLYLTHLNNPKSDTTFNRFPDENYAREVMQLFSIGLYELNQDGTRKLDGSGNFIPTYDNTDIAEFAKIFTGFTYGDAFLFGQEELSELSYTVPMQVINTWHEPGPKTLLNGQEVPDRNPVDGAADVADALDNLYNHPNVGPFMALRLIQRLIKSNPSTEYVSRVAAAFNDNGQGVRGDMKAVVRAVLKDPEARDCGNIDDPFEGMLREPMVRYVQICKAFNAASIEGLYRNKMDVFYAETNQRPLGSPSVFNFFQTDYQPIGPIDDADLVAPEFQITNSVSILGYANRLHDWIFKNDNVMEYVDIFSGEPNDSYKKVNFDLTDEDALEEESEVGELIERLNLLLLHGGMTEGTRTILTNTLTPIPENRSWYRVRMAIFLVMISPDYLILR